MSGICLIEIHGRNPQRQHTCKPMMETGNVLGN